jgi:acid phosphatase
MTAMAAMAAMAAMTATVTEHLKDEAELLQALRARALPAVAFVKPLGPDNEHPGYANLARGQQHVAELVQGVRDSPYWSDTAVVITYDENGGFWDHVAPPVKDRWGPGTRVPTIVVSPFARTGFVDHTEYDTASVLKTIEARWGLAALGPRDAAANDLRNAFESAAGVGFPATGSGAGGPGAARASHTLGAAAGYAALGGTLFLGARGRRRPA